MTLYDRIKNKRLGDVLVDEDLATEEAVIAALHEHQRNGTLLSDILMEARAISEWDLARVIVEEYQVPYVDLGSYNVHKDLVARFSAELLHRSRLIPLDRFGSLVTFACQEIPGPEVIKALAAEAPGGVYLCAASARDIREKLHEFVPAPESAEQLDVEAVAHEGAPIALNMNEDQSWQNLFDAADESIQSGDE